MLRLLPAAALLTLAAAAWAGGLEDDEDIGRLDPKGYWHFITKDAATTTSKCVGNRESIACAVATHWAEFVRSLRFSDSLLFRIDSVRRLSESDIPEARTVPIQCFLEDDICHLPWEPGQVKVSLCFQDCWDWDFYTCKHPSIGKIPAIAIFKRVEGQWFMHDITWSDRPFSRQCH